MGIEEDKGEQQESQQLGQSFVLGTTSVSNFSLPFCSDSLSEAVSEF